MESGPDNIKKLFNDLKSFSFLDRLFRWNSVRTLLIDASADLQKLIAGTESVSRLNHELEIERNRNKSLEASLGDLKFLRAEKDTLLTEKTSLESKNEIYLRRGTELSNEISGLKQKLESRENELVALREEYTKLRSVEEERRRQHEHSINNLNVIVNRTQQEREQEKRDQHQEDHWCKRRAAHEPLIKKVHSFADHLRVYCYADWLYGRCAIPAKLCKQGWLWCA